MTAVGDNFEIIPSQGRGRGSLFDSPSAGRQRVHMRNHE